MLFAATVGDDDIKLFKYHARLKREQPWTGQIVEIDFGAKTNFDWNHKNFDDGYAAGWAAAEATWKKYERKEYEVDPKSINEARDSWRAAIPRIDAVL